MRGTGRGECPCRSGFTLVEVVVAMLVGSVALLALAGVMASTANVQQSSESRMEYVALAESRLDRLRAAAAMRTADTMQLTVGGSLSSDVTNKSETVTSSRGRNYTVRWLVAPGLNGTRDVTVRVAPVARNRAEVPFMDFRALMTID
jgi:prepilin-type N-terminal cleavage/methylation domain-containing protein